jgi:hypothetical protein
MPFHRIAHRASSLLVLSAILIFQVAVAAPNANAAGIAQFTTSASTTAAGGHPDVSTTIKFEPGFQLQTLQMDLPPGLIGNPNAVEACSPALLTIGEAVIRDCPVASQVGTASVTLDSDTLVGAVFNLEHGPQVPARLVVAFQHTAPLAPITVEARTESDFGINAITPDVNTTFHIAEIQVTLWGAPNARQRGGVPYGFGSDTSPILPPSPAAEQVAFMTNPTVCDGPKRTELAATFMGAPNNVQRATSEDPTPTDCAAVPFAPDITLQPTSRQADSPTGLDVELTVPQDGLTDPDLRATSHLKDTAVDLPAGISVNPAAADGLAACTTDQIGFLGNSFPGYHPIRFDKSAPACPDAAKIGSLAIDTPILGDNHPGEHDLTGSIYLAAQSDNPFDSLFAIYLVASGHGVTVKLVGEVTADPETGRLQATFLNNPQLPFSRFELHLKDGPRAPLATPPVCGVYETHSELTPWSDPGNPVELTDAITIDRAPGGGACPADPAARPLGPTLSAGLVSNAAGASSPFVLRLTRPDGDQEISSLGVDLPPGLSAKLAGVGRCSDATLAAISAAPGDGAAEAANPSCPASSLVGVATVGAGAGPSPLFVKTGRAYLAGPYLGAPLSLAAVVPAVAGPFDLGTTVVRNRLLIDRDDAQVHVESDPFPTILSGIPVKLRDIRVNVDRPDFMRSPTNCEPMSVGARVRGVNGALATASDRFQVDGCGKLGFKPKLNLRLFGGIHRGDYPRLRAVLTARDGDANISRATVRLPRSEFLAQNHIRTVCTRVQFAAEACPPGSIYGTATAITPLLDAPLAGNVYLRSSSHKLPDLVAVLKGPASQPIEIDLVGRIDSVRGGIRNTFEGVPDAPVSRFVLEMQGGRKGLLINSTNICRSRHRATARIVGQNDKRADQQPRVRAQCGKRHRHG